MWWVVNRRGVTHLDVVAEVEEVARCDQAVASVVAGPHARVLQILLATS